MEYLDHNVTRRQIAERIVTLCYKRERRNGWGGGKNLGGDEGWETVIGIYSI